MEGQRGETQKHVKLVNFQHVLSVLVLMVSKKGRHTTMYPSCCECWYVRYPL
jgi:hypothetical protein